MTLDDPIAPGGEALFGRGFQYKHGEKPLDGYTIQRAAGRGGFGEVYYAVSDSGREVALKLVHTYEQIELRGISQCMNLKSPHLVTIFDVKYGEDGRPWVIMEFVSGPSLRQLIDASPTGLGPAKSAFFLREIGKGLTYLHDCGIVHRDLKPGNIFYENGYVKIGDYGLSKTMSVTRHSGQTVAVGTLHYMAPEIGEGKYDRSIDIYAMGALLFEMLTGQVPFFGSSPAEVLMKHLTADVNTDKIDEPFRSTIRKAMAKNPADRFQSVQEMVQAVFGSEQIQSSVADVSPESLTMVAGRIAGGIGSSVRPIPPVPPSSSASPAQPAAPNWTRRPDESWQQAGDRWAKHAEAYGEKMKDWGERFADRFGDSKGKFNPKVKLNLNWRTVPPGRILNDTFTGPLRAMLCIMAVVLAACIASLYVQGRVRDEKDCAALAVMAILGAVTGARIAWRLAMPGISGESKWVKRFVLGAPAAFGAALFSAPLWNRFPGHGFDAVFLSLMLVEWHKRIAPYRKERVCVGHLFSSGLLAFILANMFDANDLGAFMAVTIVAGASLAASLFSPFDRTLRDEPFSKFPGSVPAGPVVNDFNVPPPIPPSSPPPPPPPPQTPPVDPQPQPAPPPPGATGGVFGQNGPFGSNGPFGDNGPFGRNGPFAALRPKRKLEPWEIALIVIAAVFFFGSLGRGMNVFSFVFLLIIASWIFKGDRMLSAKAQTYTYMPAYPRMTVGRFASGIARLVFTITGTVLLVLSLLLCVAVTSNLPGLFASGVLDPNMPAQITQQMGTANWPQMFCNIGAVACIITGVVSLVLLLIARRAGGGLHVLRTMIGMFVLFEAALCIGKALPKWSEFVLRPNGGQTLDLYMQHVDPHSVMKSVFVLAIGLTILLWPPRRRLLAAPVVSSGPTAPASGAGK